MWKVGLTVAMCLVTLSAAAIDASTNDAPAILLAVFDRQQGSARSLSRMKMSIRDSAGTRERLMDIRSKRFAEGHKRLIQIEQPDEVRNTGFLSIDYTARARTDEQWLYLPKLHRVSRVPDSGKADAFVGSDFSLSDLAGQNPDDYNASLLEASTRVGDEDCWHIDATPRDEAVRDATGYTRTELWISKRKLATLQLKAWIANSTRVKYMKASEIRNVGGIWTAHRVQMRTLDGSKLISETLIELLHLDNDAKDVQDADFTEQRLERGL